MRTETRAVLADAYGPRRSAQTLLTHAVELDEEDREVRVLCNRVKLDSLADRFALSEADRQALPTCAVCARAVRQAV